MEAREVEMSPIASNITGGRGEWEVVSFCFFEVVWGMCVEDVLYKYSYCAFPEACEKLSGQKVANPFFFLSELYSISTWQATEPENSQYI